MKFEVYDKGNPDRLLGTLHVAHDLKGETYRVPLRRRAVDLFVAEYDPDASPVEGILDFELEWRCRCEEIPGPNKWSRKVVREEWAVLVTEAKISDLIRCTTFDLDGLYRLDGDRFVVAY